MMQLSRRKLIKHKVMQPGSKRPLLPSHTTSKRRLLSEHRASRRSCLLPHSCLQRGSGCEHLPADASVPNMQIDQKGLLRQRMQASETLCKLDKCSTGTLYSKAL